MPDNVKKAGSLISLSVLATSIVTSVSLTLIYYFGNGVLDARETRVELPYIIKSVDHISIEMMSQTKKIDTMISQRNLDRLAITTHSLQMERCKERMAECENHVNEYHKEHK